MGLSAEGVAIHKEQDAAEPFPTLRAKNIQLKFFMVYHLAAEDTVRAQRTLQRLLARDEIIHNVAERMPLSRIVEAHEMIEQGLPVGNVVLSVAPG